MPWSRNDKPSVIGLSGKAGSSPRHIEPGATFEAAEDEIPKSYLDQKWIVPTDAPKEGTSTTAQDQPKSPPTGDTAGTGSGQFTGPEPVQQSGTSAYESTTDSEMAESGAYGAGTTTGTSNTTTDDRKRRK